MSDAPEAIRSEAHMPQLVGGVADDAVRVRGGVAVSELEVPAPHRVAEEAAPLAVDQAFVELAVAAFTAFGAALDQAAYGGHGDIGKAAERPAGWTIGGAASVI
jgi:hypothetical protein